MRTARVTMAARRLLQPVIKAAAPRLAAHTRAMSGKIDDVKIKDIPAYVNQVANDPKTRTSWEEFKYQYWSTYIKPGTADPVFHVIGIMMVAGYSVDYYFHLRHEANYKYH
uniref:ATP synthase subunit f, mitochondrial n=1 Tax=Hemiselmis andersenii TaxID=464988 RepID=A0A7S0TTS2_HEMAN